MASYSSLYMPDRAGVVWIDQFREKARAGRMEARNQALSQLKTILGNSVTPETILTGIEALGEAIGRGGYRFLLIQHRPVLLRPGTTVAELITQLAGPAPRAYKDAP